MAGSGDVEGRPRLPADALVVAFIEIPDGDGSNFERAFARRPEVFAAWQQLNGAIKATSELRRYELATLAAARRLRSSYCCLAHGKVLAEQFYDYESVPKLPNGLDDADRAIMAFAEKVVVDATAITQADVDELRAHGLSDDEVFDVALTAAARCFFSKTLDALGVQPDAAYSALEASFVEASTVGRPIAS
jgi:alkylhydroperoxidase family enzyme